MRKNIFLIFLIFLFLFIFAPRTQAFEIQKDPQYVIVNFADLKEKENWNIPDSEWETKLKPIIKKRLEEERSLLGAGNDERYLAWSIILTYMDFPLDTPSDQSAYVVYIKRIMEVADELNFPVFLPLNGSQWWNQLPELWNYWDPDGNHTEGCKNDEYTKKDNIDGKLTYRCAFTELRDPVFRKRFIQGYNPENKWNVEWRSWTEPMPLNSRDWGGGPFQVAPPPNFFPHNRTRLTYDRVLQNRLKVIVDGITPMLKKWEREKRLHLFAGLALGTEINLNANIKKDDPFVPYGYRGIQDLLCPKDEPICGAQQSFSKNQMQRVRQEIVYNHLFELSKLVAEKGIPKERIYTHVWSEVQPGDPKYVDYFEPAVNIYSRPGLSLYSFAGDPFQLKSLKNGLEKNGNSYWGVPELGSPPDSWQTSLRGVLHNTINPAKIIDIYNEREIQNTTAIPALQEILRERPPETECKVLPVTPEKNNEYNPLFLNWKNPGDNATENILIFTKSFPYAKVDPSLTEIALSIDTTQLSPLFGGIEYGTYYWYIKRVGCGGKTWTTSLPQKITYSKFTWRDSFTVFKKMMSDKFEKLF